MVRTGSSRPRGAGVTGLPAGCAPPLRAEAKDIVESMFRDWSTSFDSLRGSIDRYFTDDTVWENVGLNRLVGRTQALRFIDEFRRKTGFATIDVEIDTIVSGPALVMVERRDALRRDNGAIIHSTRVMGVFEMRDGKVVAQRDYFPLSKVARHDDG